MSEAAVSEPGIVRWGALGCARVLERRMIPGFAAAANARLVAVASRSLEKAQAVADRFDIPTAYGAYDDLLADPNIDAVFVPLPNDLHCEWTLKALAAGKHVLCDKPMALSLADAKAMSAAATAAQLRLMEGFMYRHHPQHAHIRRLLDTGVIGEPTHFRAIFAYPAPRDLTNIRFNASQGGGALLDVGVYGIDAARYLFGSEPTDAVAIVHRDPETGVDLHTVATLSFPGGKTATVTGGFDHAFTSRYEIAGPGGVISAERAFQVGDSGVDVTVRANNSDASESIHFPHIDQYGAEIAHFSAAVLNSTVPLAPGEDGVAQAAAVEKVLGRGC